MRLRNAMLTRRIIRRPIKWTYGSLASHTTVKLASNFLSRALFQWVGAPTRDQRDRANDR